MYKIVLVFIISFPLYATSPNLFPNESIHPSHERKIHRGEDSALEKAIAIARTPLEKAKILTDMRDKQRLFPKIISHLEEEINTFEALQDVTTYLYKANLKSEAEHFFQKTQSFVEKEVEKEIEEEEESGNKVSSSEIDLLRKTKSIESAQAFLKKGVPELGRRILHKELSQASLQSQENFFHVFHKMQTWGAGETAGYVLKTYFPLNYLRDLGWNYYQKLLTYQPGEPVYDHYQQACQFWYGLVLQKARQGSIEDKREVAYWLSRGEQEKFSKNNEESKNLLQLLEDQVSQGTYIQLRDYAYWCYKGEKVPKNIKKGKLYYQKMINKLQKDGSAGDYYKVIQWYKTGRNIMPGMTEEGRYKMCKKLYDEMVKKDNADRNQEYRAFRYARGDSTRFNTGDLLQSIKRVQIRPADTTINITRAYVMYKEAQNKKVKRLSEDQILNLAYQAKDVDLDRDYLAGLISHLRRAYSKAFEYYKRSADQDHRDACYTLAEFYTEKDIDKVINVSPEDCIRQNYLYMKKAAELGHRDASYFLGGIFYIKRGYGKVLAQQEEWTKEKLLEKAISYYEMASENGDYRASDYLGRIYEENPSPDPEESFLKALKYYDLAYDQGSDKALNLKANLLKKGY